MSILDEGIDLIKASKEWKDEYEKKHDTKLYIYRITHLNDKLCEENEKLRRENEDLKKEIYNLEHPNFVLNKIHIKILDHLKDNEGVTKNKLLDYYRNSLDIEIAFNELLKYGYIIFKYDMTSGYHKKIYFLNPNEDIQIEILKAIKEDWEEDL